MIQKYPLTHHTHPCRELAEIEGLGTTMANLSSGYSRDSQALTHWFSAMAPMACDHVL